MPLSCNIDARGKLARLVYGILLVALGIVLAVFWAWPGGAVWQWIAVAGCAAGGAFAIFEARAGWCVVRAMGIKTPM